MVKVLFMWRGSGVGSKGWAVVKGGVAAVSYCLRLKGMNADMALS